MCAIDWDLLAEMLSGIGSFLGGLGALLALWVVPTQLGLKRERDKFRADFEAVGERLILKEFHQEYASEDGIAISYPRHADEIAVSLSARTGLDPVVVSRLLAELHQAGRLAV